MTAKEMYEKLYEELTLKDQSVVFNVIDMGCGNVYVDSGICGDIDDLHNGDSFFRICEDYREDEEFDLEVFSYMLGDGESETACSSECETIEKYFRKNGSLMQAVLDEYAESMAYLSMTVANPEYSEEEDEE